MRILPFAPLALPMPAHALHFVIVSVNGGVPDPLWPPPTFSRDDHRIWRCQMKQIRKTVFVLMAAGGGVAGLGVGAAIAGGQTGAEQAAQVGGAKSGPCTVHYSGMYDWGRIDVATLDPFGPTDLPTTTLQLQVTCTEPTLFALKLEDGYAGSAAPGLSNFFAMAPYDGESPGGYRLRVVSPLADGNGSQVFVYEGGEWKPHSWFLEPGTIIRFSNGTNPDWSHHPISTLTVNLEAPGLTRFRSELPAEGVIHFHGTVKVSLEYL
jgi:hypothetical protein